MTAVPADTPVTTPPEVTVAIPVLAELQVPTGLMLPSVIVEPAQTTAGPEPDTKLPGVTAFTVTVVATAPAVHPEP